MNDNVKVIPIGSHLNMAIATGNTVFVILEVFDEVYNKAPTPIANKERYIKSINKGYNRYKALISVNDPRDFLTISMNDEEGLRNMVKSIESNIPIVVDTLKHYDRDSDDIIPLDNILTMSYILTNTACFILSNDSKGSIQNVSVKEIIDLLRVNHYFLSFTTTLTTKTDESWSDGSWVLRL